jgi:hypothetical protein
MTPYRENKESLGIAIRVYRALTLAGWKLIRFPNGSWLMGGITGILVDVHPAAPTSTRNAAETLGKVLN